MLVPISAVNVRKHTSVCTALYGAGGVSVYVCTVGVPSGCGVCVWLCVCVCVVVCGCVWVCVGVCGCVGDGGVQYVTAVLYGWW